MARILCIGNSTVDIFVVNNSKINRNSREIIWPLGTKIPADKIFFSFGGSAVNVARSLVRARHTVKVFTQVGRDQQGENIEKMLKKERVHSYSISGDKPTTVSVIYLTNGERTIFTEANDKDYDGWTGWENDEYDWIFLGPLHGKADNLYKAIQGAVIANKSRLLVVPSMYQIENDSARLHEILRITDVFVANWEEATTLTHGVARHDGKRMAATIEQLGPSVVALTNGKSGALIKSGEIYYEMPAPYVEHVLDTTGAGDAFVGGALATLAQGDIWDAKLIKNALKVGLQNSATEVSQYGAGNGLLTARAYEKLWKE